MTAASASERGYWTAWGPAASVDWCEPNYVVVPYVAEWWNTLSSLAIVLGALGAFRALRRYQRIEGRFAFALGLVAFVGLGSAAFHGTLLRSAQAADELPMIYVGLIFIYMLRFRSERGHPSPSVRASMVRWRLGLGTYAFCFTLAYFALQAYFLYFILSYAALVTFVVVRSLHLSFVVMPRLVLKRRITLAVSAYVGGVLFLWIPENLLFACDHPIQELQLHAWFHLTSAMGSNTWVIWAWTLDSTDAGPA